MLFLPLLRPPGTVHTFKVEGNATKLPGVIQTRLRFAADAGWPVLDADLTFARPLGEHRRSPPTLASGAKSAGCVDRYTSSSGKRVAISLIARSRVISYWNTPPATVVAKLRTIPIRIHFAPSCANR